MLIEANNVRKAFGKFQALRGVSLSVRDGELLALLGPSGCGKTTLLRIIAGLEAPDSGTIHLDGRDATRVTARQRGVGFVFQHYALFRHMTIFENVAFGLRVKPRRSRLSRDEIREKVLAVLRLVQLESLASRYPAQLSGGQRQRVALARALAVEPRVLLLDEPFGSLDAQVRQELRRWLRRLHDEIAVTSVFVTHDQEEALEVADRIAVLRDGSIEQVGAPEEVYDNPRTSFVHGFLGSANQFRAPVENGRIQLGSLVMDAPQDAAGTPAGNGIVCIRPHLLEVSHVRPPHGSFQGTVLRVNRAGPIVRIHLRSEWGDLVRVEVSQERQLSLGLVPGSVVYLSPLQKDVYLEKEDNGPDVVRARWASE